MTPNTISNFEPQHNPSPRIVHGAAPVSTSSEQLLAEINDPSWHRLVDCEIALQDAERNLQVAAAVRDAAARALYQARTVEAAGRRDAKH